MNNRAVLPRIGLHLVLVFSVPASTLAFAIVSGDGVLIQWCLLLTLHGVMGLWLSFAIHEAAHLVLLKRVAGVNSHISFTLMRISVVPHGLMSGWQIARVALAGPMLCVGIGIGIALTMPEVQLQWWYLAHAIFVLPLFGDGRSLIKGLALRNEFVRVP